MKHPTVKSEQKLLQKPIFSFFNCPPETVVEEGLIGPFKRMGIHISFQLFNSPGYSGIQRFEKWQQQWHELVGTNLEWCVNNNFRVLGMGDEFFRTSPAWIWINTCDWAERAVRYVAKTLADLGICDGIEMVDEIGDNPAVYNPWNFVKWWRDSGGPPISWPNQNPYKWEVPELSDYCSRFWPWWVTNRANQVQSIVNSMSGVLSHQHCSALISIMRAYYYKRVEGGDYQYRKDKNSNPYQPVRPEDIMAQFWAAMSWASIFRIYGVDWRPWREQRLNAKIDERLQTGSRPGDEVWTKIEDAIFWIRARGMSLYGPTYVPVRSGPYLSGQRGNISWVINDSAKPKPSPRNADKVPPKGVVLWNNTTPNPFILRS